MNLNEAKRILNNNGYFLKEDARRNSADLFDIFHLIDVHDDWSPEWVAEEIMKHYYEHDESITVDYIDDTNYEDYIGKYVNVKENVDLSTLDLTKLPIRFGTVGGFFFCDDNKLTSLEGAPEKVGGYFSCADNKLTSLKGAPKVVGGDFYCFDNAVKFTEDDVLKVSNVKGKINH